MRSVNAAGTTLKQAAEPVKQSTAQLTQNLVETSAQMKTLADTNQTTRENLAALTLQLANFVRNFNGIVDQLERATEIITDSLDSYNTKTNEGLTAKLKTFDKSMSEAVGHLQSLIEDLSGALEDFNRNRR